jgi:hypothetical protein
MPWGPGARSLHSSNARTGSRRRRRRHLRSRITGAEKSNALAVSSPGAGRARATLHDGRPAVGMPSRHGGAALSAMHTNPAVCRTRSWQSI